MKQPESCTVLLIIKISEFHPQTQEEKNISFSIKKFMSRIRPEQSFSFSGKDYFEELIDFINEKNLLNF
jgi:hypothetical protein